MRGTTTHSYQRRIAHALEHIASHLGEPLSTREIAKVAHLSPWHFHRVFRAVTGATLGDVIRAMRLESGASALRNSDLTVTRIALDCGYESGEALSRAFRRHFGMSPSHYRRIGVPPGTIRPGPRIRFHPEHGVVQLDPIQLEQTMEVRIETLPARDYLYLDNVGSYDDLSGVFESLVAWSHQHGIDLARSEVFSYSFDNPKDTPEHELRSQACLSPPAAAQASGEVKQGHREARRYAVHTLKGHYDGISDAYVAMVENFIASSDEEIADAPFMEIYLNDCSALPPEEWLTRLCIPLAER